MASVLAGAWAWNSRSRLEVDLGGHEDSKVVRVAGEVSADKREEKARQGGYGME